LKSYLKTISHKWLLCWNDVSCTTFGSLPWRSRSQYDFQQISFWPITLWFEVKFYNYFTGMITILRPCVTCNIWVATLKAKVTAWPCSKTVSGPKLCYLKLDFTTTFDKLLLCVKYLFREHYPVPTGSCSTGHCALDPWPTDPKTNSDHLLKIMAN